MADLEKDEAGLIAEWMDRCRTASKNCRECKDLFTCAKIKRRVYRVLQNGERKEK